MMDRRPRAQHPHRASAEADLQPQQLLGEIKRLLAERDRARKDVEQGHRDAQTALAERDDAQRELANAEKARDDAIAERDGYLAALQRERAEFTNFKRRTAEQREAMLGLAAEGLVRKVLALADDFDRALETRPDAIASDPWVEGIAAIDRKLRQLLESEGVAPIAASPGVPFDPREHEAVVNVPNSGRPDGEIVEELRRGYRLRDRVIRPAMVAVAEHTGSEHSPESQTVEHPPIH
jgi:molecular chaperone GrpE